jgi:hypothetical protein
MFALKARNTDSIIEITSCSLRRPTAFDSDYPATTPDLMLVLEVVLL